MDQVKHLAHDFIIIIIILTQSVTGIIKGTANRNYTERQYINKSVT